MPAGRKQGSSIPAYLYRRLAREQSAFDTLIGLAAYPDAVALALEQAPVEQVILQYVSAITSRGSAFNRCSDARLATTRMASGRSRSLW